MSSSVSKGSKTMGAMWLPKDDEVTPNLNIEQQMAVSLVARTVELPRDDIALPPKPTSVSQQLGLVDEDETEDEKWLRKQREKERVERAKQKKGKSVVYDYGKNLFELGTHGDMSSFWHAGDHSLSDTMEQPTHRLRRSLSEAEKHRVRNSRKGAKKYTQGTQNMLAEAMQKPMTMGSGGMNIMYYVPQFERPSRRDPSFTHFDSRHVLDQKDAKANSNIVKFFKPVQVLDESLVEEGEARLLRNSYGSHPALQRAIEHGERHKSARAKADVRVIPGGTVSLDNKALAKRKLDVKKLKKELKQIRALEQQLRARAVKGGSIEALMSAQERQVLSNKGLVKYRLKEALEYVRSELIKTGEWVPSSPEAPKSPASPSSPPLPSGATVAEAEAKRAEDGTGGPSGALPPAIQSATTQSPSSAIAPPLSPRSLSPIVSPPRPSKRAMPPESRLRTFGTKHHSPPPSKFLERPPDINFKLGTASGAQLKYIPVSHTTLPRLALAENAMEAVKEDIKNVLISKMKARQHKVSLPSTLQMMRSFVQPTQVTMMSSDPSNIWYLPGEDKPNEDPVPRTVPRVFPMTLEHAKTLFETDWDEVELADLVKSKEHQEEIADMFWDLGWYRALREIHCYFSCATKVKLEACGKMFGPDFLACVRGSKLLDKKITTTYISMLFHRVNIDEEYEENEDGTLTMVIKTDSGGDDVDPDQENLANAFTRSEFMEALVRLAVDKFGISKKEKNPFISPIKRMMFNHMLKHEFSSKIRRVYEAYAAADDGMADGAADDMDADEFMCFVEEFDLNARPNGINMRYLSVALGRARDENFFKDSFTIRFATFVELLIRMAKIRGVRDGEPPGEGEAEMYRAFLNLFQVCCQKANAFVAAFLNPVCRLLAATRELFTLVTGPKVNHKTRINPTKKRKMVRWWTEKPTQTSLASDPYSVNVIKCLFVDPEFEPRVSQEPLIRFSELPTWQISDDHVEQLQENLLGFDPEKTGMVKLSMVKSMLEGLREPGGGPPVLDEQSLADITHGLDNGKLVDFRKICQDRLLRNDVYPNEV